VKLKALYELFCAYNTANRARRTAQFYRDTLAKVARAHGELDADQLRPHHLLPWRATWHLIVAVQRLYRWAAEQELATAAAIVKMRRPRPGKRRRVLSRRDLSRLLRAAPADLRRLLLAARETAARPLEVRELSWDQLEWPDAEHVARALTTGRASFALTSFKGQLFRGEFSPARHVAVSPRLGRLLLRLRNFATERGIIFTTARGRPWTYSALRCRMRKLRVKAGMGDAKNGEKICCYTLRHSAATQWIADGMEAMVAKELLGHARIETTQRYVHLNRKQVMNAWEQFQRRKKKSD
jgi:integrase